MRKGFGVTESYKICKAMAKEYQKEKKGARGKILDGFVKLTGYTRCYGSWLLRNWGSGKCYGEENNGWYT